MFKELIRFIILLPVSLLVYLGILAIIILISPIILFVFLCVAINKIIVNDGARSDKVIQFEPEIGWKPKPNMDNVRYFDRIYDSVTITTDEDGWPTPHSIKESDVIVFGDSFAFGYGSKYEDTYFALRDDIVIKPIAASGYNMVQSLMLMEKYQGEINDKLVFWLICLENDLIENLRPYNSKSYRNPFLRNKSNQDWELVNAHINPQKWMYGKEPNNHFYFANLCYESAYSNRVFSAVRYLLQEAKVVCDTAGSELVIFTIPDKGQLSKNGIEQFERNVNGTNKFDAEYPDRMFAKICSELNIAFMPGKSYLNLEDYKKRDSHWNKKGNRKISDIIYKYSNDSISK